MILVENLIQTYKLHYFRIFTFEPKSVLPCPQGRKRNVYPIILTAQKSASISIYIHKVFFLGP